MDRKIGIIANDEKLKNSVLGLFPEDVEKGNILIEFMNPYNEKELGEKLEARGAKAIIARGGGYRATIGKVGVPVVHLKLSTLDILHALKKADKYGKDIVLFISDFYHFDYEEWKDLIGSKVTTELIFERKGIEDNVDKYLPRKDQIVVVGEWIPANYAKSLGMDNISIDSSDESILECFGYAREIVDSLNSQKYKNELLNTTLDGVHDAVVAANQEGRVIIFNKKAQELLKKSASDVVDQTLTEILPEMSFVMDVLKNKTGRQNEIVSLNKAVVAANTSLLEVDGHIQGVLCSFQDITKLQNLEKKIRYELNKKGLFAKYRFSDIVARDALMQETVSKAIMIGQTDCTVMLYGESGTGKEMIAQSIHNISSRSDEPFVAINCAALTDSLLESELFGYEDGAFTGARKGGKPGLFELAHKGTIFLDEINSISLNLQAKLLRVLEEKEVMRIGSDYIIPLDVRVIAAANEGLKEKLVSGSFRKDLFYRLNIFEVHIPPLRNRRADILPLFYHYLEFLSKGKDKVEVGEDVEQKILGYSWPGNVRELKSIVQRYLLFDEIELDDADALNPEDEKNVDNPFTAREIGENTEENFGSETESSNLDLKKINRLVEDKVIEMLQKKGLTKTEIAKQLGISRTALWKKTRE